MGTDDVEPRLDRGAGEIYCAIGDQETDCGTKGVSLMAKIRIEDLPKHRRVSDQEMRQVTGGGPYRNILSNPWVLGTIVATAIAVPIAVHDDETQGS